MAVPPARYDLTAQEAEVNIGDYVAIVGEEAAKRWPLHYDPHGLAARSEGPWVVTHDRNPAFVKRVDHPWRAARSTRAVMGGKR